MSMNLRRLAMADHPLSDRTGSSASVRQTSSSSGQLSAVGHHSTYYVIKPDEVPSHPSGHIQGDVEGGLVAIGCRLDIEHHMVAAILEDAIVGVANLALAAGSLIAVANGPMRVWPWRMQSMSVPMWRSASIGSMAMLW